MIDNYKKITKKNTKTFYYSTIFFRKEIKEKVFLLYSFVRIIDDFVDKNPPDKKKFNFYKKEIQNCLLKNKKSKINIINDISQLIKNLKAEKILLDYLITQEKELTKKIYQSYEEFNNFIYGVAGTIGLIMVKIINLPKKTYKDAINLGKSLQIINNVRDIYEDYLRKKIYIPEKFLKKFNLNYKNFLLEKNNKELNNLIIFLINQAFKLEKKSQHSYKFFNKKDLFPVLIARNFYFNIAKKILKNYQLIFHKNKLKPSFLEIIIIIIKSYFQTYVFIKKN